MAEEPTAPNQQQEAASAAAKQEVDESLQKLRDYGYPIAVGLVLALAVVGGLQLYRAHKRSVATHASQLLNSAQSASQLQEVVNLYSSTPSAPVALLALASQYFSEGNYEQAQQTYRQFGQTFPEHPMKDTADYGVALCMEASGLIEPALDAFSGFAQANPDHFLTPQAILGSGRCLDQLGRLEEAKAVYEDYMAANPESPWSDDAGSLLMDVEKQMRGQGAMASSE